MLGKQVLISEYNGKPLQFELDSEFADQYAKERDQMKKLSLSSSQNANLLRKSSSNLPSSSPKSISNPNHILSRTPSFSEKPPSFDEKTQESLLSSVELKWKAHSNAFNTQFMLESKLVQTKLDDLEKLMNELKIENQKSLELKQQEIKYLSKLINEEQKSIIETILKIQKVELECFTKLFYQKFENEMESFTKLLNLKIEKLPNYNDLKLFHLLQDKLILKEILKEKNLHKNQTLFTIVENILETILNRKLYDNEKSLVKNEIVIIEYKIKLIQERLESKKEKLETINARKINQTIRSYPFTNPIGQNKFFPSKHDDHGLH